MPHDWDEVATVRRQQIEDGLDLTFSRVFGPYYLNLISRIAPSSILEIGGGTGHLARLLASIPDKYVVLEPSQGMYEVACEVLANTQAEVQRCTIERFSDNHEFALVFSHMCIQVVDDLGGFLKALAKHISPAGDFLLSLPHPAFYNDYKHFFSPDKFRYIHEQSGRISFSITLDPGQVIENVPYHHRPLSRYVSELADAGLCLTQMEEIYPTKEIQDLYGQQWKDPRYLVLGGHPIQRDLSKVVQHLS